jgi:NADP-dependent 3-hydroxy acid dehydrogenase YdfG
MNLDERVVAVTGAAGGLGRVVVRAVAEQGARLALIGRNRDRLEQLSVELALPADRIHLVAADLREAASAESAASEIAARFVHTDILLHLVDNRQRIVRDQPTVDRATDWRVSRQRTVH